MARLERLKTPRQTNANDLVTNCRAVGVSTVQTCPQNMYGNLVNTNFIMVHPPVNFFWVLAIDTPTDGITPQGASWGHVQLLAGHWADHSVLISKFGNPKVGNLQED